MSKFLDWAMELLGLSDEYDVEEGEVAEPTAEEEQPRERFRPRAKLPKAEKAERPEPEKKQREASSFSFAQKSNTYQSDSQRRSKVVNMSTGSSVQPGGYAGLNMVIQQPSSYSDALKIAKNLKDRQPVVVNLENVDKITAQKIVDFLGGAVYALDGKLTKVANGIVVAVPNNMGITGIIKDDFTADMFAEIDF